jgi:hypothetical protein
MFEALPDFEDTFDALSEVESHYILDTKNNQIAPDDKKKILVFNFQEAPKKSIENYFSFNTP